jgi:peptide chain release factor 3
MPISGFRHPIVGVVGALQFDVIAARLQSEYGIQCSVEPLPYTAARWPASSDDEALAPSERGARAEEPAPSGRAARVEGLKLPLTGVQLVKDRRDRNVLLFASDWELRYCAERNPGVKLNELSD